jgi:hypothetical protein
MCANVASRKRVALIMSNVDERLEGIEDRVEILLERQRLSRFDNLMFLAYPLVILSITLSLTISFQYEALRSLQVWGVSLVGLLEILRALLGLCLGAAFVVFLLAYAVDSLDLRLVSVLVLASSVLLSFGSSFVLVALLSILGSVIDVTTTSVRSVIVIFPFVFSALLLLVEGVFRTVDWVCSWFKGIMRISLRERVVTLSSRPTTPPRFPLMAKASWSVGSLVCFLILAIAGLRGQLGGKSVHDVLYASAFLIATEAIMLYSSYISHAVGQAIRKPKKVG